MEMEGVRKTAERRERNICSHGIRDEKEENHKPQREGGVECKNKNFTQCGQMK